MWLIFIGGGVKSIVLCVLPWKQGMLLFGWAVYSCRSVESVCVCVCVHDVCDSGGEAAVDEDRQDKEEKKAVVDDKVVEIKPRG